MKQQLNLEMLIKLQEGLENNNPFVYRFIEIGSTLKEYREIHNDETDYYLKIHNTHGKDMRIYNAPQAQEIAVLIDDNELNFSNKRDIIVRQYDRILRRISELHGAYDPLQYPLLFPYREYGWHDGIFRADVGDIEEPQVIAPEPILHTGANQFFDQLTFRTTSNMSDVIEASQRISTQDTQDIQGTLDIQSTYDIQSTQGEQSTQSSHKGSRKVQEIESENDDND